MSDASPVNGAAPKVRKAAAKAVRAAPKVARKAATKVASKVKGEARSFAAEAEEARQKLVATAIHRHARGITAAAARHNIAGRGIAAAAHGGILIHRGAQRYGVDIVAAIHPYAKGAVVG